MSADMHIFIDKPVNIITCDGRVIVGILKGYDQTMNLVLTQCHERIFSIEESVRVVQLGVYLVRGENVAIVGEMDEELDGKIEYETLKAIPLNTIVH